MRKIFNRTLSNVMNGASTAYLVRLVSADSYNAYLSVASTLLKCPQLTLFTRLRRSPFADAYWFLYSTKSTHYTQRHLTRS